MELAQDQFSMGAKDTSWDRALDAVRTTLHVPAALSTLIRGAWGNNITPKDFFRLLGYPGSNSACLVRAAESTQECEPLTSIDVEGAIEKLGVRTAAVTVAVSFVCQSMLESAPPEKVWLPVLKRLMSDVEIGYHFGMSAERLGTEEGILVGFSYWAGLAVLLGRHPREFAELFKSGDLNVSKQLVTEAFGCEAYQAGSLALQQLGFGPDVATAAAIAVGDLRTDLVQVKPEVATWRAARLWISALGRGELYPTDESAQQAFPELIPPVLYELGRNELPLHLSMLYQHINQVREVHSAWTWHLPRATYEETGREVAKNGMSHAYTTSRTQTAVVR
jgi:hypothetical protein